MQIVNYGNIKEMLMFPEETNYIVNSIQSMNPNGLMVEWGCGGSTFKWLETFKDNQRLTTIEHNPDWYDQVQQSMRLHFGQIPPNFNFILTPTEKEFYPYYGVPQEENPVGLRQYINPDSEIFDADIFFVDGIARAACAMTVLLKRKKKNSVLFIHDYSPRITWYNWVTQFCDVEFIGTTLARLHYGE